MTVAIDNDILFKGACYGLLNELIATTCSGTEKVGTLGSARFVVAKKIEKNKHLRNHTAALAILFEFLHRSEALEPTQSEQHMAADLELAAQRLGINLDSGESQLCAMLVFRVLPILLTGDKRAITAMEKLIDADNRLIALCGKVRCLEQLVYDALTKGDHVAFRTAVCAEPEVDKALAICFSCTSQSVVLASIVEGLQSYVKALRAEATRVLST
jgi:hypothetical protein